jgi:hypothetical protein
VTPTVIVPVPYLEPVNPVAVRTLDTHPMKSLVSMLPAIFACLATLTALEAVRLQERSNVTQHAKMDTPLIASEDVESAVETVRAAVQTKVRVSVTVRAHLEQRGLLHPLMPPNTPATHVQHTVQRDVSAKVKDVVTQTDAQLEFTVCIQLLQTVTSAYEHQNTYNALQKC